MSWDALDFGCPSPPERVSYSAKTLEHKGGSLHEAAAAAALNIQQLRRENNNISAQLETLRRDAELIPELERELLFHADRADELVTQLRNLEDRNRNLEVLSHARLRSKQHLVGARQVRCLLRASRETVIRRVLMQWHSFMLAPPQPPRAAAVEVRGLRDIR